MNSEDKHPSKHAEDFVDYVTEERSKGEPNSIPAKAIEFGASMLIAAGIGMGAGVGMASRNIKNAGKFNTKAYDAAQQENLDLSKAILGKSRSAKIANTVAEHSLFSGSKLKDQAAKTNLSFERNLDKNTIPDTLANVNKKDALYKLSEKALADKDLVSPKNTLKGFKGGSKKYTR